MNFIYSILRKYLPEEGFNKRSITAIIFMLFTLLVVVPLSFILILEKLLDFNIESLPVYIGFPIFSFLPLVALVYAYYPGYKYLESVQKYSVFKVTVFFWIIILTPFAGMYLLSEYF
jgi:hypothetical protein